MTVSDYAFQDRLTDNHCFGCGAHNSQGLRIKSYWQKNGKAICRFIAQPHHCSGPTHYLNGGIVATLLDCHAICTAIAQGYRDAGREVGEAENILFVTGKMDVTYKQPVPIAEPVDLVAEVTVLSPRKTRVLCQLFSGETLCAEADVLAVRVNNNW